MTVDGVRQINEARAPSPAARRKVLFVQIGDFREAVARLDSGAKETYRDQSKSVAHVRALAEHDDITVVALADETYDEVIAPGLRCIGFPAAQYFRGTIGPDLMKRCDPDLVICRLPHPDVLAAAAEQGARVFALFADTFPPLTWRSALSRLGFRQFKLTRAVKRALSAANVTGLANHGLAAAESVRDVLDIPADQVIPWEWSQMTAQTRAPRAPGGPFRVLYAGSLIEAKGVSDLIGAVQRLQTDPGGVRLDVFGEGENRATFEAEAKANGADITFHGRAPADTVLEAMGQADAVVVPSHKSYTEGLPNVVFEGLSMGAPIVISDHPAMLRRLKDGEQALVARASDPDHLAETLRRLRDNPELRAALEARAAETLSGLYVGMDWYEMIDSFLKDPENSTGWVQANSLQTRLQARASAHQTH